MKRARADRASRPVRLLGALVAPLALSAITVPSASASTVDRPYFRAGPVVVVFGASDYLENGGQAPIVGDFLLLDRAAGDGSGRGGLDLITGDLRPINYNSRRFNPINNPENAGLEYEITDPTSGGAFNSAGPHQTLDANDSYDAFGLDGDTDIELQGAGARSSRFYVASNAPFDIFARADNLTSTGSFADQGMGYDNIRFRLRVNCGAASNCAGGAGASRWGTKAQDPSVGGNGVVLGAFSGPFAARATLADLALPDAVKVFDGGRRTATAPGSILEQAVSFQARYNLLGGGGVTGDGFDFSIGTGTLAADVTYTVYSP